MRLLNVKKNYFPVCRERFFVNGWAQFCELEVAQIFCGLQLEVMTEPN